MDVSKHVTLTSTPAVDGRGPDQGVVNVSHGCINLSAESAQAYLESAIHGDPVQVTGTSVQLSADDGDIYDWALSWEEWKAIAIT